MRHVFIVLPGRPCRVLDLMEGIIYPTKIKKINRDLGEVIHSTETRHTYILYLEPDRDYVIKTIKTKIWSKPVLRAIYSKTTIGKASMGLISLDYKETTYYRLHVRNISYMEKTKAKTVKRLIESKLDDMIIHVDPPRHLRQVISTIKWSIAYIKEVFYVSTRVIKRFSIEDLMESNKYIVRKILVNTRRIIALA